MLINVNVIKFLLTIKNIAKSEKYKYMTIRPPQARNSIRKAMIYVAGVRFPKGYYTECKKHFRNRCAYCGSKIGSNSRTGHFDHSFSLKEITNEFHLIYSCNICNGDEKREKDWKSFLKEKCGNDTSDYRIKKPNR